jgi:hypothetical protein
MLRDEVLEAIGATERRLEGVAEGLRNQPEAPTATEWTARQTLCHIAARANDVPLVLALAARAPGAPFDMAETHAANAKQLADRAGRAVDELLAEARQGYAAARNAVAALDEEELGQNLPELPGIGIVTVADMLKIVFNRHAQSHVAAIEQALSASQRGAAG